MLMWTTRCRQDLGGGTVQTSKARAMQRMTASCLLLTALRALTGRYLRGDHREGVGDVQKVEEDDNELEEDDEDDDAVDWREERENLDMED